VSPQSRQILDTHQRLRRTLRNFLFNASRHLVDLRARFEVFQDAPTDATRFHVYQSRLARLLRITQTLHHRFEFTASGIESAWNYRVDAALTAARGLRRRTQARLREIDARLEARAVRRARRQLADNRAEAEQLVARAREALDGKVDQLLTLQARLNKNAALTEGFWTANAEALRQAARWDVLRENEGDTASRLRELAELRAARVGDLTVDLLACGVVEPPVNRNRRIRIAGLGAGLTLLTVLLGQWWITRSR
ncbi:MAG: hypothetical protein ACE5EX_08140, partial [Phycisphaerae bacterium]